MPKQLKDSSTTLSRSGSERGRTATKDDLDLEDRETRAADEARLEIEIEDDDELGARDGEELDEEELDQEELGFDANGGHAYSRLRAGRARAVVNP